MEGRFGELKIQEGKYPHIGHEYEQTWDSSGDTTITDSQEFYTSTIEPVPIPPGPKSRLLTALYRRGLPPRGTPVHKTILHGSPQ